MIKLKRAYEPAGPGDGRRFLIDRLWPRGIKKEDLQIEAWLKDIAPSTELRQWFHHEVPNWPEFEKRYRSELKAHPDTLDMLRHAAKKGTITLVYGAKDQEHNDAVVLKQVLEEKK